MMIERAPKLRTTLVFAGLFVLIAGLHFASRFGLRGPAELSLDGVRSWASDPELVIATIARWLSLILAYYLAVVLGAATLLGERFEDSFWRRLWPSRASGLLGLALGTSAVLLPLSVHDEPREFTGLQPAAVDAETLDLRVIEAPLTLDEVSQRGELQLVWSATWTNAAEHAFDDQWHVESGDSFWSIAEETLRDNQPHVELTNEHIVDYWRTLIQANENRLIDPANPDFLLPGQQLVLPPTR